MRGSEIKGGQIKGDQLQGQQDKIAKDWVGSLVHGGYMKTISLPPNTQEIRISTNNSLLSPIKLHLVSTTSYQKSLREALVSTSAVVFAQTLLALFACGVAYFGKLRLFGWFSWWLISLSVVTVVSSGVLAAFIPPSLAATIELHCIGAVASLFGLATLRLEQEFSGSSNKFAVASRKWFGAWLMVLALISISFPHPFVVGLIWISGALYCGGAALRLSLKIATSSRKVATLLNALAWLAGALTIST